MFSCLFVTNSNLICSLTLFLPDFGREWVIDFVGN
jgi:hypothetical protein